MTAQGLSPRESIHPVWRELAGLSLLVLLAFGLRA